MAVVVHMMAVTVAVQAAARKRPAGRGEETTRAHGKEGNARRRAARSCTTTRSV